MVDAVDVDIVDEQLDKRTNTAKTASVKIVFFITPPKKLIKLPP